jgi:Predicted GTPase
MVRPFLFGGEVVTFVDEVKLHLAAGDGGNGVCVCQA